MRVSPIPMQMHLQFAATHSQGYCQPPPTIPTSDPARVVSYRNNTSFLPALCQNGATTYFATVHIPTQHHHRIQDEPVKEIENQLISCPLAVRVAPIGAPVFRPPPHSYIIPVTTSKPPLPSLPSAAAHSVERIDNALVDGQDNGSVVAQREQDNISTSMIRTARTAEEISEIASVPMTRRAAGSA